MATRYEELVTKAKDALKTVDDFWKTVPAGEEYLVPKEKREEIAGLNDRVTEWGKEAEEIKSASDLRHGTDAAKSWLDAPAGTMRHPGAADIPPGWQPVSRDAANAPMWTSIAEAFMGNDSFKAWHGNVASPGHPPSVRTKVQSPVINMPDLTLKTLVTSNTTDVGRYSNTSGGAFVRPQVLDTVALPFRPLKLREVVTVIEATSPLIEYPKVTGYTNNAAAVPEATTTSDSGGNKPESALAVALATSQASVVAHYMPISRQALSDAPAMRDLVNTFLLNGLDQAVEDAMISGNGTGANLTGITNISGVSQQAFVTSNLVTLRKAITKSQTAPIFVEPNAFLISPTDAEGLDLATDNESRFYYGGPSMSNSSRIWNKPVIVSQAVPAGTVFTGDLKNLVLADLMAAQMFVTDTHSDWFIRNLLAILAELRLHFFCLRPAAVIQVTLGAW